MKERKTEIFMLLAIIAVLALIISCSDLSTPSSPDPSRGGEVSQKAQQIIDSPTNEVPTKPGEVTATRPEVVGAMASSIFTNTKSHKEMALLCVYYADAPVTTDVVQRLYKQVEAEVEVDSKKTLSAEVKDCYYYQVDSLTGKGICPPTIKYSDPWPEGLELLEANNGRLSLDCEEKPCKAEPMPNCSYGPAIYNPINCSWKCPTCEMPEPPECPFGDAVPMGCDWVCPPCTTQCAEGFHLHPETCDCWCDPVGEPECDNQVWNERTCSWEGDCYECDSSMFNEGCYEGNVDTSQHLFDQFGICMSRVQHSGSHWSSCKLAEIDAAVVIVKGGNGFRLYTDVQRWDIICSYCGGLTPSDVSEADTKRPNISHISYFDCDPSAICRN